MKNGTWLVASKRRSADPSRYISSPGLIRNSNRKIVSMISFPRRTSRTFLGLSTLPNDHRSFYFRSEYLVKNKYAAPGKVAINGVLNGGARSSRFQIDLLSQFPCLGLLVAACINRAPEGTFGSAVAELGVHDLLKVRSSFIVSANCLHISRSSTNSLKVRCL